MRVGLMVAALGLAAIGGCARGKLHDVDTLKTRAAFDFQCTENELAVTSLENGRGWSQTAGVQGCGKRATYVQTQQGTWVMNTGSGAPEPENKSTTIPSGATAGANDTTDHEGAIK